MFTDPAVLSDSYLVMERVEKIKRLTVELTDVDLPPDIRQFLDASGRLYSQIEKELGSEFKILPKNLDRLKPLKEFLEEHGIEHPEIILHRYYPKGDDEIERDDSTRRLQSHTEQFGGLLIESRDGTCVCAVPEYPDAMNQLTTVVGDTWSGLSVEQESVVLVLQANHRSMILALLLAIGRCSPSDYALAVLASEGEGPFGVPGQDKAAPQTLTADEEVLRRFHERYIEEQGEVHDDDNQTRYNQILGDANCAVDYLRLSESWVMGLIRGGESKDVEFKSSFRWSFQEEKINARVIQTAALKEIVAFLNSGGGTLLLGVSDDGSIVGIEYDNYRNQDEYLRSLLSSIRERIGLRFVDAVQINFWQVSRHDIISVKCSPAASSEHAFLDEKELYVRQGPMSISLTGKQLADWLRGH